MKLAVVALIRNEIDIVGSFLQHLDALFDYALLMNHGSIDGTDHVMEAACARRPGWTMWQLEPVGYHQPVFGKFALQHLFRHTDADVAMFLDADEFIAVPDRAHLEAAFAGLTDPDQVGAMHWCPVVPERLDTRVITAGETIWRAPNVSVLGKTVIPRLYYARHHHEMNLVIGNHGIFYGPGEIVPSNQVGEILHLPVRSYTQLKSKVVAGVFSIMAQAERLAVQGWHWYDILWRIGDGTLSDDDLIGIAAQYSEPGNKRPQPVSRAELQARGFTRSRLDVAFGRPLASPTESLVIDPVRLVATILRRFQVEDIRSSELVLDGNHVRFMPQESRQ